MMKAHGWIVYNDEDYTANHAFADHMIQEAEKRGFGLEAALTSHLLPEMKNGKSVCRLQGQLCRPDFIISRQRDSFLSAHWESMGIFVSNNAKVCRICNDKRRTHQFLQGIPMLETSFPPASYSLAPAPEGFPLVLKPANSHGGDRVFLVKNSAEWQLAAGQILPDPMVQQETAADLGKDLRIYVVFGKIVAAVMRTAQTGFVSNFKLGGLAALHSLTYKESALAKEIIARFAAAGAPLDFAGIDFLYHHGEPVCSEVEDVVGSRMLYQASDLDIAALYWDQLAHEMAARF